MPHLRIHGPDKEKILKASTQLIDKLAPTVDCPRDHFTIEHIHSISITDGKEEGTYPFIEMHWFDRGSEIQDSVAGIITDQVREVTDESTDIAVVFHALKTRNYYENGAHFG